MMFDTPCFKTAPAPVCVSEAPVFSQPSARSAGSALPPPVQRRAAPHGEGLPQAPPPRSRGAPGAVSGPAVRMGRRVPHRKPVHSRAREHCPPVFGRAVARRVSETEPAKAQNRLLRWVGRLFPLFRWRWCGVAGFGPFLRVAGGGLAGHPEERRRCDWTGVGGNEPGVTKNRETPSALLLRRTATFRTATNPLVQQHSHTIH